MAHINVEIPPNMPQHRNQGLASHIACSKPRFNPTQVRTLGSEGGTSTSRTWIQPGFNPGSSPNWPVLPTGTRIATAGRQRAPHLRCKVLGGTGAPGECQIAYLQLSHIPLGATLSHCPFGTNKHRARGANQAGGACMLQHGSTSVLINIAPHYGL